MSDATSLKPPRIDGRRLRSERTKQLIIEAFLSLLRDNPQMPTAVQIAERAGYRHAEYMSVVFKRETGQTPGQYRRDVAARE